MHGHSQTVVSCCRAGKKRALSILSFPAAQKLGVRVEDIVLSSTFRDNGRCWMCPPDIGKIDGLMTRLKKYSQGLLYQAIYENEDSFYIEGMGEASVSHTHVSHVVNEAVKLLLPGCLHLSCGGCHLCERCA